MDLPKELTTVTPVSKGLALILVVLLPITGFLLGMKYQSLKEITQQSKISQVIKTTPSPIAKSGSQRVTGNWLTYTNPVYNFSFKYPEDYSQLECPNNFQLFSGDTDGNNLDCNFADSQDFSIFIVPLNEQPESTKTKYREDEEYYNISEEEITIDNQLATKYIFSLKPDAKPGAWDDWYVKVDFTNNNFFYSATTKNQAWINNFNRILSTFEFPDQSQSVYSCPVNGWVNCMPILTDEAQKACTSEAVSWYKTNCPDFAGIAQ